MMSKNNNEERKCKMCGKTIVGKNKTGICSACKKESRRYRRYCNGSSRINRRSNMDRGEGFYKKD